MSLRREFQLEVKFHSAAYWSVFLTNFLMPMSSAGSLHTYITILSYMSHVISTLSTYCALKMVKNVENRSKIVRKTLQYSEEVLQKRHLWVQ